MGRKTIEVRSWRPEVLPLDPLLIVENHRRLTMPGDSDPDGLAVAVVRVVDVHPWLPAEAEAACAPWEAGWLAWVLEEIRPIAVPFQIIAARRIYDVEIDEIDTLNFDRCGRHDK